MTQWLNAKYSALWAEIIEVIRADKFKSSPYYHDSIYAFFYIYIFIKRTTTYLIAEKAQHNKTSGHVPWWQAVLDKKYL